MIAKLVVFGLVAALLASAITGLPAGQLPGVALGSGPLLIVERAVAFFTAWMVCLVIVTQALRGHLSVEISGRGVKYANVDQVEATKDGAEEGVQQLSRMVDRLRWEMLVAERRSKEID